MLLWTIDAFADATFRGGPASVLEPQSAWPTSAWMQRLAEENGHAETAFLVATSAGGRFGLRWFTPTTEVPLCGHATLAAAHVLFHELELSGQHETLVFETAAGELEVRKIGRTYELSLPADPPCKIESPKGLAAALDGQLHEAWAGRQYLCAVLADPDAVLNYIPDTRRLAAIASDLGYEQGSLVIAAQGAPSASYDVISRFFAPLFGIPEDPVTGSAHSLLAPLFAERLGLQVLRCFQAFPGRGAILDAEVAGDRVRLRGEARTFAEGRLRPTHWPDPNRAPQVPTSRQRKRFEVSTSPTPPRRRRPRRSCAT